MTPTPPNGFTRFFVEAFNEKSVITGSTAFQVFFGRVEANNSRTIISPDALDIDIDIIRGNRKTSAYISRGVAASARSLDKQRNTKAQEGTSFSRKFPLIEELGDVEAIQLTKRLAGENPYFPMSQQEKLRFLILQEHAPEQVARILRRTELSAAESVLTGVMTALDGATGQADFTYDFKRNSDNTVDLTGSEWNTGTPDIIGDLGDLCDVVFINGKSRPDMCVMGDGAYAAYANDATVLAKADNRSFASDFIQISMVNPVPDRFVKFVDAGFIPRGMIKTDNGYNLWLFTDVDVTEDNSGTSTKIMTTDKVLVCSSIARADRYFGPDEQLPVSEVERQWMISKFGIDPNVALPAPENIQGSNHAIVNGMFYFDAYQSVDRKRITFRTQAAPIYATTQTDAFGTLTDLLV